MRVYAVCRRPLCKQYTRSPNPIILIPYILLSQFMTCAVFMLLHIVASATAVVRMAGAARTVAVARGVMLALDHDAIAGVVVAVDEQREEEGQEEEDAVPGICQTSVPACCGFQR